MKKKSLLLVILLLLVSAFSLTACKAGEQGEVGDKGDKGAQGAQGPTGDTGADGEKGDPGDKGADGQNATAPEFEVTEEGIKWRREGEEEWHLLVSIDDLIGYSKRYTVNFDANGGNAVEPLKNQVYKTVAELPEATKAGFTFVGWADAEGNLVDEYHIPAADSTLTAVWGSTVTLSSTAYGATFDVSALTAGPEFTITAFNGITKTFGNELGMTNAANRDTVTGTYWYRLVLKSIDLENGVFEITDVIKDGVAQPSDFEYMIGVHSNCEDATSLAALKDQIVGDPDNSYLGQILVVEGFDPNAEKAVEWKVKTYTGYEKNQTVVTVGENFTLPTNEALEGKAFLGWTVDGTELLAAGEVKPNGNIEYLPVYQYTLTYELNGGTGDATEDVNTAEKAAAALVDPEYTGFVFDGYYFDEEFTEPAEAKPLKAATLYAKWIVPTNVTYDLNGGMAAPAYDTVITSYNTTNWGTVDGKYWPGIYPASRLGSTGTYWYHIPVKATEVEGVYEVLEIADSRPHLTTTAEQMDFVIVIYSDCANPDLDALRKDPALVGSYVLLGNFPEDLASTSTKAAVSIKLFYNLADAKGENPTVVYTNESSDLLVPVRDGYEFAGWFDAEGNKVSKIPAATEPTALTLTAKWEGPYTGVTYVLDGGLLADVDTKITSWNTTNWATVDSKYWPGIYPAERLASTGTYWYHIPVKASDVPGFYEVLEVADARTTLTTTAEEMDYVIVIYKDCANPDLATLPTDPNLVGSYVMLGNFPEAASTSAAEISFKLFYSLETVESFYEYYLEAQEALPTPIKTGYKFLGWFDAEDNKVTALEAPVESSKMTLTAKWGLDVPELTVAEIQTQFLKDVNASAIAHEYITEAIDADEFYSTFVEKFMNVTAVDPYTVSGLMHDDPELFAKYAWLIEWIGAKMGDKKYGNTALVAFGLKSANDENLVTGSLNYADRTITNSIHNFLTGTGETLHGGSSSGAVPASFTAENAYDGLLEAAYAVSFTVDAPEPLTVAEIADLFMADFNAFSSTELEAAELDTDCMSGSKIGDFFADETNYAKWGKLANAIYEVAQGSSEIAPDTADWTTEAARKFYLANLNGYFTGTQHTDTWWEYQSADFSNAELQAQVTAKFNE